MADPQKITSKQLLQKIRSGEPRLSSVEDDKLLQWAYQKNPKLKSMVMDANPPASDPSLHFSAKEHDNKWDWAQHFLDALPGAGGMIGATLGAPASPVAAVGGAGVGAGLGSAAKHGLRPVIFPASKGWDQETLGEAASDISLDMMIQGLTEGTGQVATAPARSIARKFIPSMAKSPVQAGKAIDNLAVRQTGKEFGLNLSYPQQAPGPLSNLAQHAAEGLPVSRETVESIREGVEHSGKSAVKQSAEKAFGKEAVDAAPNIAGKEVQRSVTDTSSPLFKQRVGQLKSILNAHAQRILAKRPLMLNLKTEAMDELTAIAKLKKDPIDAAKFPKDNLQIAEAATGRRKILEDIVKLKDSPRVLDLIELRSKLMSVTPETTELLSKEAPGTAKHYVQKLTEIIDDSLKGTPAGTAWKSFRNFTRKGSEVFEAVSGASMLDKDPEKIAEFVGTRDITKALQARRAINSYTQKLGDPAEKKASQAAWNKFRAIWFEKNIGSGDILSLSERMKNIDPRVLDTIIGSDADGKLLISNLRRLSSAFDRVGSKMKPGQAIRVFSTVQGGAYLPITKFIHSKSMTDKVINTAMYMAKHPEISPANASRLLSIAMNDAETPNRKEVPTQ